MTVLLSMPEGSMFFVDAVCDMSQASMSRRRMRATACVAVLQSTPGAFSG
jgi:hypothetical protein